MFKIALCDDSKTDLNILSSYLEELKQNCQMHITTYDNGPDLINDYKEKGFYDLLILDMRMDEMNGIEVAKHLREIDKDLPILIVTATVDYAVDGYKVNAFRYLVKPIDKEEFQNIIKKILEQIVEKRASTFTFPSNLGTTKLTTDHIYYLESDMRTIKLVAEEGVYEFTGKISALEEELKPYGFMRIHKSFLVNIGRIHNIYKESVTMDNSDIIPMSKHKRKDVNQKFLSYMELCL